MKQLIETISHMAIQQNSPLDENHSDGRLASAIAEGPHLNKMQELFNRKLARYDITFEIAPPREWKDFKVGPFHINLKITTGGTDNAFNKRAIIFTICGTLDGVPANMNINQMMEHIKRLGVKRIRDTQTEYYYLVVHKETGETLFKSILDIHNYISNPSNTLQINWNHEFANKDYVCDSYES